MVLLSRIRGRLLSTFGMFPPQIYKHRGIAWFGCISLLLLTLSPMSAYPQSTGPEPISTADKLVSELLSVKTGEQPKATGLLRDHKKLITPYLWLRLINESARVPDAGSPSRSLFVLELAREAAEQLDNKRLLAHTFHRIGFAHFACNDFKAALDSYLLSKR